MRNYLLAFVAMLPLATMAQAEPVGGATCRSETIRSGYTDSYDATFRAGELAIVAVSGDGDTDLDLYVYDENGNLIESDTDRTDQCVVSWTPRWTGRFTIRIVNHGHVYNNYTICIG